MDQACTVFISVAISSFTDCTCGPINHLQIMLVELYHPDGAMGFQRGGVHFAHIVHRQAQTGNAVIQRNNRSAPPSAARIAGTLYPDLR